MTNTQSGYPKQDVKAELLAAGLGLTEADFDTHESDLYVLAKPGVREWLKKNYHWWSNVTMFASNPECSWAGKPAFDIPFANLAFWERKQRIATGS